MGKGRIFYYKDPDLLVCECSACENVRMDYQNIPKSRQELTCRERIVNFLRKIIFR